MRVHWIFKTLAWPTIRWVIFPWIKNQPWWVGMMVAITSMLTATAAWIKELSLFWAVLVSMGSGIAVGLIALGLSILWEKYRSARPPTQEEESEFPGLIADKDLMGDIDKALNIPDDYNLYLDLKGIYSRLKKLGVPMPLLGPANNPTWRQYHFNFLYRLRRRVNTFDLEEWKKWVDSHESNREERIEEIRLDCKILKFLCELEKECRHMTNKDVHMKFLGVLTEILDDRLIALKDFGFISASVTPTPSLGIPEHKHIDIHGVSPSGKVMAE